MVVVKKTEPQKPSSDLPIQVREQVWAFFSIAMASKVGNGSHTLFWMDRWLHVKSIEELAPRLVVTISGRRKKNHGMFGSFSRTEPGFQISQEHYSRSHI